jgi:hypothetical protein
MPLPFSPDHDFPRAPMDIINFESRNLASAEPQSSEQKQNRIVASSVGVTSVAGIKHPSDIVFRQILRYRRLTPVPRRGNDIREIDGDLSPHQKKPKKTPQDCREQLDLFGAIGLTGIQYEVRDIRRLKAAKLQRAISKSLDEKSPDDLHIRVDCDCRETALVFEIFRILNRELCQLGLIWNRHWRRNNAFFSKVAEEYSGRPATAGTDKGASLPSFLNVALDDIIPEIIDAKPILFHPFTEISQNPALTPNRFFRIPECSSVRNKRIEVWAQQAVSMSLQYRCPFEVILQHVFSFPAPRPVQRKGLDYAELTRGRRRITPHVINPGVERVGIIWESA